MNSTFLAVFGLLALVTMAGAFVTTTTPVPAVPCTCCGDACACGAECRCDCAADCRCCDGGACTCSDCTCACCADEASAAAPKCDAQPAASCCAGHGG